MTDLNYDDYDPRAKESRSTEYCWIVVILCAIVVGFIFFFMLYTYVWSLLVPSIPDYGLGILTLGLVIALVIVVYILRNRRLERLKVLATSDNP